MSDQTELLNVARERAEARIDAAIGSLRKHAAQLGIDNKFPDNIAGHSASELLGRIAYVPSLARDLRRTLAQSLAQQELQGVFASHAAEVKPSTPAPAVAQNPATIPVSLDLANLSGVPVAVVRACKAAGLATVGDVNTIPDEHLLKINGLAERSVALLRAAIAKAATPQP